VRWHGDGADLDRLTRVATVPLAEGAQHGVMALRADGR